MAQLIPEGGKSNKTLLVDPREVDVVEGFNPRTEFGDLDELAASIAENGVLNPISVQVIEGRAKLVDGERRLRATLLAISKGAAIAFIPAIAVDTKLNDVDKLSQALIRNTGKPLTEVEEAKAFQRLRSWGLEVADIAKKLGVAVSTVRNRLKLLTAAPEVLAAVQSGEVSVNNALRIAQAGGNSVEGQRQALAQVREARASGEDLASVRARLERTAAENGTSGRASRTVDAAPAAPEARAPVVSWQVTARHRRSEEMASHVITLRSYLVRARSNEEARGIIERGLEGFVVTHVERVEFGAEGWFELTVN